MYFLVYIFKVGSITFNHTYNQNPPMSMSCTHFNTPQGTHVLPLLNKTKKTCQIQNVCVCVCGHSLDCMTEELWDSCSVHRFHPSSRSTRCLNSPNCSYIPSFLQFRGSSCLLIGREQTSKCKKNDKYLFFFYLQITLYRKYFIFDRQINVFHNNPRQFLIENRQTLLAK